MLNSKIPKEEKRKYRRLDTIFPVEFQFLNQELNPISGWYQAFSQDISKGGICLTVNNLDKDDFLGLESRKTKLLLQIHSPLSEKSFLAYGKISWAEKTQDLPHAQYIIGLTFTKVDMTHINRLLGYARFKKILWCILKLLIVGMLLSLCLVISNNFRLQSQNISLINKYSLLLSRDLELNRGYHELVESREELSKSLNDSKIEMEILTETLKKIEDTKNEQIALLEGKLAEAKTIMIETDLDAVQIEEIKASLEELKKSKDEEMDKFQKAIISLKESQNLLSSNMAEILTKESETKEAFSINKEQEAFLAKGLKDKLYTWIKRHQNQRTGLIVSFEGDGNLRDTSFTYDQALAIIAYTMSGDYQNARKGLDFFLYKAKKINGEGFYNAYYSNRGQVAEYIAHAGPNLWLGIAVLQFTNKTDDYKYINVAKQIAYWVEALQDKEGGIIGGKDITWYSTEHNLDGFAFFTMLYEVTQEERYKVTASKILSWLEKYAYGNGSVPVNRGKGDSTIATDTYAWSIAAIGPKRLKEIGMKPDEILEFAIENCLVMNEFTDRSGKKIIVEGFDFAKNKHIARGGVISCEWTAQMVLSFHIMSDYYFSEGNFKKSTYFQNQKIKYLGELNKMIIASSSAFGQGEWCLPYALRENVDTGHGWRTPQGNRTGSVAATAYTIFAISKFNPLQLPSKDEKK